MKLFNTISLEINARCNRSCAFCPVAYNRRPEETMSPALLTKAFSELAAIDYRGRIEFYIYNEPTRNLPHLLGVIAQARATVPRACLMLATNGDYLRGPENIVRLYTAGLNQLLINCYSPGLYAKRLPWLAALPASISRTQSVYAVLGPRVQTVQMLDKSNPTTFGTGIFRLVNRAGNIPQFMPALAAPVERMCVKPFRIFNINWQGSALVCCQDYHGKINFGSLKDCTLVELWNHPVMNEYRRRLLQKDRTLPLCRQCDCHAGAYTHNVPPPAGPYASKKEIEELWLKNRATPSLQK